MGNVTMAKVAADDMEASECARIQNEREKYIRELDATIAGLHDAIGANRARIDHLTELRGMVLSAYPDPQVPTPIASGRNYGVSR